MFKYQIAKTEENLGRKRGYEYLLYHLRSMYLSENASQNIIDGLTGYTVDQILVCLQQLNVPLPKSIGGEGKAISLEWNDGFELFIDNSTFYKSMSSETFTWPKDKKIFTELIINYFKSYLIQLNNAAGSS
jgi:hypothetical protein